MNGNQLCRNFSICLKFAGTELKCNSAYFNIAYKIYVSAEGNADFLMTRGICNILAIAGNKDDLIAFMSDHPKSATFSDYL